MLKMFKAKILVKGKKVDVAAHYFIIIKTKINANILKHINIINVIGIHQYKFYPKSGFILDFKRLHRGIRK